MKRTAPDRDSMVRVGCIWNLELAGQTAAAGVRGPSYNAILQLFVEAQEVLERQIGQFVTLLGVSLLYFSPPAPGRRDEMRWTRDPASEEGSVN